MAAMKQLAKFYRRVLGIPVVGITGSVGKTSTKEMIASVLEQKYRVLKTEGNLNNEIGLPLTIFKIRKEHEVAVLEMGISEFGENGPAFGYGAAGYLRDHQYRSLPFGEFKDERRDFKGKDRVLCAFSAAGDGCVKWR